MYINIILNFYLRHFSNVVADTVSISSPIYSISIHFQCRNDIAASIILIQDNTLFYYKWKNEN